MYPAPGTNKCPISVKDDLVPQMKELIIKSMYAVRKKIDPFRRKSCFEMFGYDFILDSDFNVWLIEVNTNPCIEESSELLKIYLPRMIEDMLKLTVDQMFPKIKKRNNAPKTSVASP
jgi:D-alanine-D-alanine ligase-like ATP-grasp enzyme